jgi:hypothetical protein
MTTKQIISSAIGLVGALCFGYFGSQLFGAKTTTAIGIGVIGMGALELKKDYDKEKKNNVRNL